MLRSLFPKRVVGAVSALLLLLGGCGGGNSENPFILCGNGSLDSGEQCDDGNTFDNDACLSSCRVNVCGDEFINNGVEECDGRNLSSSNPFSQQRACRDVGFSEGVLACDTACRLDVGACGPVFTPTPTFTAIATSTATPTLDVNVDTPTPSPTPTFTATPNPQCGNGTTDLGETCDDGNISDNDACPADCVILACAASAATRQIQVSFGSPAGLPASSVSILLGYPDGTVSLPGSGSVSSVNQRVTMRPPGSTVTVNDLDHALRLIVSLGGGLPNGKLLNVTFDVCEGATTPPLDAFTCAIRSRDDLSSGCGSQFGDLEGCSCTVVEPEP